MNTEVEFALTPETVPKHCLSVARPHEQMDVVLSTGIHQSLIL